MPYRRLEDRIRELCSKAVSSDDSEFPSVMSELRFAMREHIEQIRTMAVRQLAGEKPREDENACETWLLRWLLLPHQGQVADDERSPWSRCRLCSFSAKDTRRNLGLRRAGLLSHVSKQQLGGSAGEGHSNAAVRWS